MGKGNEKYRIRKIGKLDMSVSSGGAEIFIEKETPKFPASLFEKPTL